MKILLLLCLFIFGWDLFWYAIGVKPVFAWQLKKWMRSGKHDVTLIDVRTPFEYNWFHIEGAQNRPEMAYTIKNFKDIDNKKPVVVICMTGHRSPIVANRLKKRGYKNVYNLTWGMWAWKLFGGKTV
jgi:rhodanese-related sulfurtransferase